jgi:hypothetical protein
MLIMYYQITFRGAGQPLSAAEAAHRAGDRSSIIPGLTRAAIPQCNTDLLLA